ncbi:MAG: alpha/beta hydrolase [Candidatus Nomurabacteria bacterium]|nr:alpha/beta hydrolase [Candidatus Nomurabacteria bacterium]
MKQQIFVIHGGDAFNTYEEYFSALEKVEVNLEKLQKKSWKESLPESLGSDYSVYLVKMPSAFNAKYNEWKLWFEKYLPLLNDDLILIGHSLGAVFLAKYLSEETISRKIKATFLVAAPYEYDESRKLPEFAIEKPLSKLAEQAGELYMYHSKDDPVVPYFEFEKYKAQLPNAYMKSFEDRQHFNQDTFPEIVEDIRKS